MVAVEECALLSILTSVVWENRINKNWELFGKISYGGLVPNFGNSFVSEWGQYLDPGERPKQLPKEA